MSWLQSGLVLVPGRGHPPPTARSAAPAQSAHAQASASEALSPLEVLSTHQFLLLAVPHGSRPRVIPADWARQAASQHLFLLQLLPAPHVRQLSCYMGYKHE